MRIALLTEKPSIAECVLEGLVEFTNYDVDPRSIVVSFHPYHFVNSHFVYPRGRGWSDFPYVADPVFRPIDLAEGLGPHHPVLEGGGNRGRIKIAPGDIAGHIRDADLIVVVFDTVPTSSLGAKRVLDAAFPEGIPYERLRCLSLWSLSANDILAEIKRSFASSTSYEEVVGSKLPYAMTRRKFDFCFNVNSNAIIRRTMTDIGISHTLPVPSKCGLQLLYSMRHGTEISIGLLIHGMQNWKGTGRYLPKSVPYVWGLGSPASQAAIVENLMASGLIEMTERVEKGRLKLTHFLTISETGRRFLDAMHPDCEDPDLPFRLGLWASHAGLDGVVQMDRYIRTFFGKQKRFLSKAKS